MNAKQKPKPLLFNDCAALTNLFTIRHHFHQQSSTFYSPELCERFGVDWNNIILYSNCQALMLRISLFGVLYVLFIDVGKRRMKHNQLFERMYKPKIPFLLDSIQGCQTASNASSQVATFIEARGRASSYRCVSRNSTSGTWWSFTIYSCCD